MGSEVIGDEEATIIEPKDPVERESIKPIYEAEDYFIYHGSTTYKDKEYDLDIVKNITFNAVDGQHSLKILLSYFLVVGIIVAILFSFIYAHFFTKRIKHLTSVMNEMAHKKQPAHQKKEQGDELQELENDINHLYSQLIDELEIVHNLEEERQPFLRGSTHELKTPIMVMGVTIKGVLSGIEGYENKEEALRTCYKELQVMSDLVNEILDLTKIESVTDVSEVIIGEVIEDVIEMYQFSFEHQNIELIKDIDMNQVLKIPRNHL